MARKRYKPEEIVSLLRQASTRTHARTHRPTTGCGVRDLGADRLGKAVPY